MLHRSGTSTNALHEEAIHANYDPSLAVTLTGIATPPNIYQSWAFPKCSCLHVFSPKETHYSAPREYMRSRNRHGQNWVIEHGLDVSRHSLRTLIMIAYMITTVATVLDPQQIQGRTASRSPLIIASKKNSPALYEDRTSGPDATYLQDS